MKYKEIWNKNGTSPNPEHPQEIKCVGQDGSVNVTIRNNNLILEEVDNQEQIFIIPTQKEFCKIGNNKDTFVKQEGKRYEKHCVEKVVLNGSENLNLISNNRFEISLLKKAGDGYWNAIAKSNQFVGIAQKDIGSTTNVNVFTASGNNINIKPANDINTIDLFKLKLSQNPVIIYYLLQTPELIECTPEQVEVLEQIEEALTYKGGTYISATSQNANPIIEAEYYLEIK